MTLSLDSMLDLAAGTPLVEVRVAEALGSTPREAGAFMLVSERAVGGTIGGGRLEWDAIAAARGMLAEDVTARRMEVPLGPSIGQCCGGRVTLSLKRLDARRTQELAAAIRAAEAARPQVLVLGAGHVGRALARALGALPLAVRLVDSRAEELAGFDAPGVLTLLTDRSPEEVAAAPPGSGFAIMTHSHALDSLLAASILERGDFRYLGLIGSASKRARFIGGFRDLGIAEDRIARIVCPVGGGALRDKRPEVIAALAAAEIAVAMLAGRAEP